jgi:lipocalin
MQEKKVIKYTREGMKEENLVTGETKMLTLSHYGQETKYNAKDESVYAADESNASPDHRAAGQRYKQSSQQDSFFQQKDDGINTNGRPLSLPGKANSQSNASKYPLAKTSPRPVPQSSMAAPKLLNGAVRSETSKAKTPMSYRRSMLLRAEESTAKDLQENDNFGLSAVGSSANANFRFQHGIRNIKSIRNRLSGYRSFKTGRRAVRGSKFAAKRASRAAVSKTSQIITKKAGKAIMTVSKAVMNPATLKFLAIAGAIIFAVMIIFQMSSSFMAEIKGTTTEHPELTEYVAQLDNDFLKKVDALKAQYEQDDDTTVKIEGDEQTNTDPNVLAIMATGDWVVIDLTPENKAKLENCHGLINTYSVTKTSEKVKEEIPVVSGTSIITAKTIHHITIQVHVYAPEEMISKCGYTQEKQKKVLDMLDFLYQITGETGDTPNTTASGYYPVGDGEFQWPVPGHSYISSGYGTRIDPITKAESAFHTGLDIPAAMGTSVLASADGTVVRAGWNSGFGNCVIIQHKNGVQTLYGHNSELVVKKGDVVKRGQVIAKVGSTGRSTGPHCHFEFRIKGHHVDPSPYLKGVVKE